MLITALVLVRTRLLARAKHAMPAKTALAEALGLLVWAVGAFVMLSLVSHDPGQADVGDRNLGGPLGVQIAEWMLTQLGLVGLLLAGVPFVWGLLKMFGFVERPALRRLVAAWLLTYVVCGLAAILAPPTSFVYQPMGPGGSVGSGFASSLLETVGYGGALIALAGMGVAILVLTGNLAVSRTAMVLEGGIYGLRGLLKRTWKRRARRAVRGAAVTRTDASGPEAAGEPSAADATSTADRPGPPDLTDRIDFTSSVPRNAKPAPTLFRASPNGKMLKREDFTRISELLESQLREFKVDGRISDITEGPVVTTVEFEPAPGTKASKIVSLGEDLARLLAARSLRVLAPVPGKNTVGFEVPNEHRRIISFGDVIGDFRKLAKDKILPVVMGVDTFGKVVVADLVEMPHLLVAGATGSGKSVFINTLITSLVARNTAKELRMVLIDPKMVELAAFNKLPHLSCPVVTDMEAHGEQILGRLVDEMEDRYRRLGAVGARNIVSFNEIVRTKQKSRYSKFEGRWLPMPRIVLLIDEFADLIGVLGKDAEASVTRLAQKARAAGIHLVITTQRPSVNVVTGTIKANFPTRVAFRVLSGVDSRTILDQMGAETLLGKGDMLFQSARGTQRLHAPYLEEKEVVRVVKACA